MNREPLKKHQPPKKRRSKTLRLSELMKTFQKRHAYEHWLSTVFDTWGDVVGAHLKQITKPYFLKEETLFVSVKESRWIHELVYEEAKIIQRYQQFFPNLRLRKIVYRYRPNEPYTINASHAHKTTQVLQLPSLDTKKEDSCLCVWWEKTDPTLALTLKNLYKCSARLGSLWDMEGVGASPRPLPETKKKPPNTFSSRHNIRSEFLMARDDFQSFDLYD